MIAPARTAAYDILRAVSDGRSDLPSAIARSRIRLDDERDRALATEIAAGVQRWRLTLDTIIAAFARRPLSRFDPEVIEILRMGAFQILHLSRVPASAVVDDAVEMTRRAGKRSASGLVNALLRTVSRKRSALPLPGRPSHQNDREALIDYLSVTLSHPRWLAARWLDRLGFERAEQWMLFNNRPARLTLRANTSRIASAALRAQLAQRDVVTDPGRYGPDSLIVRQGRPLREPDADAGLFVVQDEASQLVALLAGDHPGPRVLDTCAAPGNKTIAIATDAGHDSLVVACDVRERRMALLQRIVALSGLANVRLVQADLSRPLPFRRAFMTVVVDAPCSGLGTLRRDPDIKWRRTEADLAVLAAAEIRMLRHASDAVAPGGRLVYATCSSEPEENDAVVDAFLGRTPPFTRVDAAHAHPRLPAAVVDARGFLRTSPDEHDLEAFFGAVFERATDL